MKYSKDIIPLIESSNNLDVQILRNGKTLCNKKYKTSSYFIDMISMEIKNPTVGLELAFENEKLKFFELLR